MHRPLVMLAGLVATAALIVWLVLASRSGAPTEVGPSATLGPPRGTSVPSTEIEANSELHDRDTGRSSAVVEDHDPDLQIVVVDGLEQRFGGVLVVLHRDGTPAVSTLTDASGTARVPVPAETMEALVLAGTRVLVRGSVSGGARQARLVCPARGVLRGRVLVDGGVPLEPVQIHVRYRSAPEGPEELLPAEAALLSWRGLTGRTRESVFTDPQGDFEVLGLVQGWEFEIRPDAHLLVAEEPEATRFHLSDSPILIRLQTS